MPRARPVSRHLQAVPSRVAVGKARRLWTGARPPANGGVKAPAPVPILTPEQYRFLRFLLDMADELAARDEALGGSANGLAAQHDLARIRAALGLFEQSPASPDRPGGAE